MGVAEVGTLEAVWVLDSADYLWQMAAILLKTPFVCSLNWTESGSMSRSSFSLQDARIRGYIS